MQRSMYDEERTLGELFSELSRETSTLVRQEVALAKMEMGQKFSEAGRNVAMMAVGGALAYAGLLAMLAALIIALAEIMPLWLSALLVGIIIAAVGYLMLQRGRDALTEAGIVPSETVETLKEDKEWVQAQTRS